MIVISKIDKIYLTSENKEKLEQMCVEKITKQIYRAAVREGSTRKG